VAVRAPHLTLLNLFFDCFPLPFLANHLRDVDVFVTLVVELQHHGVGFAAINAGMLEEVGEDLDVELVLNVTITPLLADLTERRVFG
jgi:hypothetical protein